MKKKCGVFYLILGLMLSCLILTGCAQTENTELPETVKIGFIGPLTGANAAEGLAARDAFLMYFEECNEQNLLPYKVEVVAYDDASIPETGKEVAENLLKNEEVLAVSGHWNSPVAEATIPLFLSEECPLVIWGAINDSLTCEENYPYVTRVVPTDTQENQPLAGYVLGDLGYSKIFIITDTTSYGQSNTAAFRDQMRLYEAEEVGTAELEPGEKNFRPILEKAAQSGCDAVFYGGTAQEGGMIAAQMNEIGIDDVLLFGISGITSEKFISNAGIVAAEGTIATSPGIDPENSADYLEFKKKFKEYCDCNMGAFTVYAYHAGQVIAAALGDIEGVPDRQKLTEAIANVEMDGVLGPTSFDAIGQTTNPICYLVVCQDGKWVPYDTSEYATGARTLPGRNH